MKHILIGRGKNGWHSTGLWDGKHKCSSSGGSLEGYLQEAEDGTLIYDAEGANYSTFVDWVYKGPMFDPTLARHEISRFGSGEKKTLFGMLPLLGGSFKKLGVLTLANLTSLDTVGLDVYVQAFKEKVPGVKWGKVYNHQVVWE